MREKLKEYGFKPAGSCNCGGIYTEKYKCDSYLIRVRPRRYRFAIFESGGVIVNWTDLKELENKLNEIFPRDTAVVPEEAKV